MHPGQKRKNGIPFLSVIQQKTLAAGEAARVRHDLVRHVEGAETQAALMAQTNQPTGASSDVYVFAFPKPKECAHVAVRRPLGQREPADPSARRFAKRWLRDAGDKDR